MTDLPYPLLTERYLPTHRTRRNIPGARWAPPVSHRRRIAPCPRPPSVLAVRRAAGDRGAGRCPVDAAATPPVPRCRQPAVCDHQPAAAAAAGAVLAADRRRPGAAAGRRPAVRRRAGGWPGTLAAPVAAAGGTPAAALRLPAVTQGRFRRARRAPPLTAADERGAENSS